MNCYSKIINCDKCHMLGINYFDERKENLDYAYSYKPETIKYLWIVESPPFSNPPRYFYRPDLTRYDSLFREVMKSVNIIPTNPKEKSLLKFMGKGHFLIDSAKCPVDKDNSHLKPKMIDNCSDILQNEVSELNPKNILIIKSSIYSTVLNSLKKIGFNSLVLNHSSIPFPGSGQQVRFRDAISNYLNIEKHENMVSKNNIKITKQIKELKMDSVLITNITEKDAKAKKIRITSGNKHLFPSERLGFVQKYDLTFSNDDLSFIATYTIGSKDGRSRSGILKLGDELYLLQLMITEGTTLKITKTGLQQYEINRL